MTERKASKKHYDYIIYILQAPNGRRYVGAAANGNESWNSQVLRLINEQEDLKNENTENFKLGVLEKNVSGALLSIRKNHFIKEYGTFFPNGYNIQSKGERCGLKFSLFSDGTFGDDTTPETQEGVEKYLDKQQDISDNTGKAAESLLDDQQTEIKARKALPGVWQKLLTEPDELLRDLLAEEVEITCGSRPSLDDVEDFLQQQNKKVSPVSNKPSSSEVSNRLFGERPVVNKIVGYELDGKTKTTKTAKQALVEIIKEFQRRDSDFLPRLAQKTVTRTSNLVSQNRNDLYTSSHRKSHYYSTDLENGWWLGRTFSTDGVRKNIKIACEVAGIKFGSQIKLLEERR